MPVCFCSRIVHLIHCAVHRQLFGGSCFVSEYRMMNSLGERILLPLGGRVSLPLKITHVGEYRIVSHILSHCALFILYTKK